MKKFILWLWLLMFVYENEAISYGNYVLNPKTYPYQASIWCPVIMCSGVLLSNNIVGTTATCVYGLTPDKVQVRLGSNLYYEGGLLLPIDTIIQHPRFDLNTFDFNASLLKLAVNLTSVEYSSYPIAPASLCTARPQDLDVGTATAYGAENYPALELPDTLKSVQLKYWGRSTCLDYYGTRLTGSMFCAGQGSGEGDFCPEDQGAPINFAGKICGIQNFGGSCGLRAGKTASRPVFTDYVTINNWLTSTIKLYA